MILENISLYKANTNFDTMEQKSIYFGHPISFYDIPVERRLEETILTFFPGFQLENPNSPVHQVNYKRWREERGNGMKYYFEEILPRMSAGIFLAFPEDMKFGKGVWGEAEFLFSEGKSIYEINLDFKISPLVLDPARMLTVEETKKRVYEADGKTIRKWKPQ